MFTVTFKGLLARKVRLALTALSIALGVAFVAGTLVLTDTLNSSFTEAYEDQYAGIDVAVRSNAAFTDTESLDQRQPIPASLLPVVQEVPGVEAAEGSVTGFAMMVDKQGKTIGDGALATNGMSAHEHPELASAVSYTSGRAPAGASEVAIDAAAAKKNHFSVGDRMRILFRGPPRDFTVVGIVRFGDNDSLGAATTALFDTATAQSVLGQTGQYDTIDVKAADGVSATTLRDRIAQALPSGVQATTGTALAAEAVKTVKDGLKSFNTFLLVFAGIAVFVGSFIIWNTFSILVAQRGRELALLRAIGATRRQVLRSVLVEAVAVGLLASLIGLATGVVVARGLTLLLEASGLELPSRGSTLAMRTVVVSLIVGTVVTLIASIAPARKGTKVAPVEALRESTPGTYGFSRRRAAIGTAVTAAGIAALGAGLFAGSGVALIGAGVLVTFLGVTALLPLIARFVARILGAPLPRLAGMMGRLARENAVRNPKRTASTAAALMIGLALVASVTVLASSLKASTGSAVDRTVRADLIVQQIDGQGTGLSPSIAEAISEQPGVGAVSEFASAQAKVAGTLAAVAPIDPTTIDEVLDLGVQTGSVSDLSDDGVLVLDEAAEAKGWTVGSRVAVQWPQTGETVLRVAGTFTETSAVGADFLVSMPTYDRHVSQRLDTMILVKSAPDASVSAVQRSVSDAVKDYANAEVLTASEFKDSFSSQIDRSVVLINALLLLAVVIALLGIVNTLALSVFERTRELGLLRAVGMTRRQVRAMVRWESVIISVFGAVMGTVVGIGFGVALAKAMEGQGISTVVLPGAQLTLYVALAGLAGVLAAVGPARRAAKVDVLRAVVTE